MTSCQSNCNQGRSKCPAPDACQLPEANGIDGTGIVRAVIYGLLTWLAASLALLTVWGVR